MANRTEKTHRSFRDHYGTANTVLLALGLPLLVFGLLLLPIDQVVGVPMAMFGGAFIVSAASVVFIIRTVEKNES